MAAPTRATAALFVATDAAPLCKCGLPVPEGLVKAVDDFATTKLVIVLLEPSGKVVVERNKLDTSPPPGV